MKLEWDAAKAESNKAKHGVRFNVAARVFLDPGRIEAHDGREDYGEDLWATIGYADPALLYVVYTVRDEEIIRLISARKANENERKEYRQANS
ncbi:BrnT family toxin [Verminephrobacter aporrectodeae]|uniref:BrnT family toxin n=1 Tax=Verminephrobacter aporrectodeae TaxID=1110389 RepID=UPI00224477A2|nr:BrnT family toxin [Verminephrobacter aporrectodeae]MCW8175585.1 BrnT family toxin [Verminephrobacter aporrectodeae subsp. tuberculatae]MCW8203182.1 BrnT family toxin [Verminephrobacter aporrectodeae subsp. tuberculatae]